MRTATPPLVRHLTPRIRLLLLSALLPGASLQSQDDDPIARGSKQGVGTEQTTLSEGELERRRLALQTRTHEPVELQRPTYALRVDRHDASFMLSARQAERSFFSAIHRRGFCSALLSDGTTARLDKVADLDARETRIRFRAASSQAALPPIWIELRDLSPRSGVAIHYEVEKDTENRVSGLRVLDDALWVSEADEGSVILPSGIGERIGVEGAPTTLRFGAESDLPDPIVPTRALVILRQTSPLIVAWSDPRTQLTITRRAESDERFPGTAGLFLRADVFGKEGQLDLVVPIEARIGPFEASQTLRELSLASVEPQSLRRKTGDVPELRSFLKATVARLPMVETPDPIFRPVAARHQFADVARISEHWKSRLGVDDAFFVLDRWLDAEVGPESTPWKAAAECGGDSELAGAATRVRASGHFLGVALDLKNFSPRSSHPEPRPEDWSEAFEFVEQHDAFETLQELTGASLLIVRETSPSLVPERLSGKALEHKRAFASLAREKLGLWAHTPFRVEDLESSVLFEGSLDPKLAEPVRGDAYPLFPSCYSDLIRFSSSQRRALGPGDATGFLVYLLLGQMPDYEIPPGAYFESQDVAMGEGPEWCFARDEGWTGGKKLSPRDRFIANTHQVARVLVGQSVRQRLTQHKALTADGSVQETYFGPDLRVLVNFGPRDYEDESSDSVLPPYGFVVRHPFFRLYHVKRAQGVDYPEPAFFTVEALEGKMYLRAEQVRIYRGFGPRTLRIGGKDFEVDRELRTKIW